VLLLNAVLTVEEGRAGRTRARAGKASPTASSNCSNREREALVFMLWGSYAQAKGKVIDPRRTWC
jgi:uracil-DNA glycosylase